MSLCSGGPFQTQALKPAASHNSAGPAQSLIQIKRRSHRVTTDHGGRWWGLELGVIITGWGEVKKKRKRQRDSSLSLCRKLELLNGTEGPSRGETLVIRGQRVDDVITMRLPTLCYTLPSFPSSAMWTLFPATTSPLSDFVSWMVHSTCNLM